MSSGRAALATALRPPLRHRLAVGLGWLGIYFAYRGHWLGIGLPLITTLLTYAALRRGEMLSRRQRESLRGALETAAARNRELERLGAVTSVMLQDVDLPADLPGGRRGGDATCFRSKAR